MGPLLRMFAGIQCVFPGAVEIPHRLQAGVICELLLHALSLGLVWSGPGRSGEMQRLLGKAQLVTCFLVWPNNVLVLSGMSKNRIWPGWLKQTHSSWEGQEAMLFLVV